MIGLGVMEDQAHGTEDTDPGPFQFSVLCSFVLRLKSTSHMHLANAPPEENMKTVLFHRPAC